MPSSASDVCSYDQIGIFFFSSRRRHTRCSRDWNSDVCSSDLAVRELTRFDPTPFRSRIAAEIPDFRPQDHLDAKRAKRLDRFSQLAVTSARFALADAELEPAREDGDRAGAMMGSALGGVAFAESQVAGFHRDGPRGLDPALALAVFPGAASCNIAKIGRAHV